MNDIIQKLVILSKHKNLVTSAEVSHWSESSHVFQFHLYKALFVVGFDHFSSERLGFIDAIIMNAWLDGTIQIDLDLLYNDVLLFGGIGTYRVLEFFKSRNKKPKIVGCDVDVFTRRVKKHTVSYLQKILSSEYGSALDFQNLKLGTPVTEIDKQFARAIKIAVRDARNSPDIFTPTAWKYRTKIVNRTVDAYRTSRMFIIGYHLSRLELKDCLNTPLALGMAAYNKELAGIEVSQLLSRNNLDIQAVTDNPEFRTLFAEEVAKTKWRDRIIKWNMYYSGSSIERKYQGKYALVASSRSKQTIHQKGDAPVAYIEGEIIKSEGRPVCDYDYIIFIPISKFGTKMYI